MTSLTSPKKSQNKKFSQDDRKFHYQVKHWYEITITLKKQFVEFNSTIRSDLDDGLDFQYDPYSRLKKHQKKFVTNYLPILNQYCESHLHLELSDPQVIDDLKFPRIHYHGKFRCLTKENLFLFKLVTLPQLGEFGRIQINEYRDPYWDDYCKKDQKLTRNLLLKNGIDNFYLHPSLKKNFFS